MKTAVVTGAGGFLGRHWVRFLEDKGVQVHSFTGRARGKPGPHAVDPMSPESLAPALRAAAPDVVFHLAGVAEAREVPDYYRVNVLYAANLFAALETAGLPDRQIVLMGTAAEYGPVDLSQLPLGEEAPCRPQSHYGISKLAQTQLGQAMARAGRRVLIVRPTNIIGPGMPRHMALQQFAEQIAAALHGGTKTIATGDLGVLRDFIDVGDVCQRLWALCHADVPSGDIVNVASGRGVAMRALLDRLIAVAGGGIDVRTDPARLRKNDLRAHYSSPAKLESLVHPPALTPLDDTLRRVLSACEAAREGAA